MRAQARRISHEEEEESAFVSMTDMTVGFLFIIMILLAFFASQFKSQDVVQRREYDRVVTKLDEQSELAEDRLKRIEELEAVVAQQKLKIEELEAVVAQQELRIEELEAELARLKQVDPLEEYLAQVARTRREVLYKLRDALRQDFPDLQVEISEESDALRFQGEGLFLSGRTNLTQDKASIVSRLAERLDEVLPCYTVGNASTFDVECNPAFAIVEAVQIEGHTDNEGSDSLNRELSTARANTTFFAMTSAAPDIMAHHNMKDQPVLSVAAYGPDRPVATNDTLEGRATNRRIDLRFIMVTPRDTDGITAIKNMLVGVVGDDE
ncbi:OmpA family protein [Maritimibacter sp. DP1N21-5]|uniref:OmpA family protein n=1 Tax=Maritimibacter sp. DP1N21-5 TaxID=2836867 RepID=UPI001C43F92B|nr:OmpA family protein [Maritimibacter sp. DP1N21-5]MBV7411124.1 OmpA family protein [Maritimibacter sp. DP1N21-5]